MPKPRLTRNPTAGTQPHHSRNLLFVAPLFVVYYTTIFHHVKPQNIGRSPAPPLQKNKRRAVRRPLVAGRARRFGRLSTRRYSTRAEVVGGSAQAGPVAFIALAAVATLRSGVGGSVPLRFIQALDRRGLDAPA